MQKDGIDVHNAIKTVSGIIDRNPFNIFSEADIQTLLHMEFLNQNKQEFETKAVVNGVKVKAKRVHREYMCNTKKNRIDIAIFSPKDMQNINHPGGILEILDNSFPKGKRPVESSHLIEIKFNRGDKGKDLLNGLKKDIEKLRKEYKKQNIVKPKLYEFLIIRWNISDTSATSNQEEVFKKLNEELKKEPSIQLYLYYWPKEKWESIIYPTLNDNSVIDLIK